MVLVGQGRSLIETRHSVSGGYVLCSKRTHYASDSFHATGKDYPGNPPGRGVYCYRVGVTVREILSPILFPHIKGPFLGALLLWVIDVVRAIGGRNDRDSPQSRPPFPLSPFHRFGHPGLDDCRETKGILLKRFQIVPKTNPSIDERALCPKSESGVP